MLSAAFLADLRAVVGPQHCATDPEVTEGYGRDWTGRFVGAPAAMVRPGSTEEVAAVLARCDAERVPVVPQGGNSGLAGGGVPLHGELVLSLRRLDALGPVDELAGQVTAGAGVTIARLAEHANRSGWDYGVDLGARDVATVGGTMATNAGGMHVLRYGGTRRQVVGYEAVLADGRVLRRLGGLEKDNTGYDLGGLLCGSEGTLAVVTAARLRLVPHLTEVVVALCGFDSAASAVGAAAAVRRTLASARSIELFLDDGLELVRSAFGLPAPCAPAPAYLLVEAASTEDPAPELERALAGLPGLGDAAVATDAPRRAALWRYREGHTVAINALGPPVKLDVTLPVARLAEFVGEVRALVAAGAPGARVFLFGHAGDGNVHVNVIGAEPAEAVVGPVLTLVASLGGSISAEHGIGTLKRPWVHLTRSPEELAVFRAIKRALDPNGILNPNALLPAAGPTP